MRKTCYLIAVSLVTLGVSTAAIAAVGVPLPPPGGGVNNAVKSPPLQDSETWTTSIDIHNTFLITNWAGYIVGGQVVDSNEVTLWPCTLGDGTIVQPAATPKQAIWGTVLHTAWVHSGISLPASQNVPIMAALVVHATNTTTGGNDSQFDIYVDGWNIRHVRATGTTNIVLRAYEDMIWASSNWDPGTNPDDFEWPPPLPPDDPDGKWVHMPYDITTHAPGTLGTHRYATLAGKFTLDIQHVPDPASGLLVLSGVGSAAMARRARKRRLAV